MLELLEAYGLIGIQHGSTTLLGFFRAKILAALLGPFGVGIASQANAFFLFIQGFYTIGLGAGFTKLVAEHNSRGEHEKLNRVVFTTMLFYGAMSLVTVGICIALSGRISNWIFDTLDYQLFIIILSCAGVIWIQFQVIVFTLKGLFLFREFTLLAIVSNVLSVVAIAALVFFYKITGAVLSIFAVQVISLSVAVWIMLLRIIPANRLYFWKYKPDFGVIKNLLRFVAPSATVNLLAAFTNLYLRSEMIRQYGASANGFYQMIQSISFAYMGFLSNSIWSYGLPKISSLLHDPESIHRVQNNGIRIGLLILAPLTVALLASREIWIPILYSPEFISAGSFLIWQFAGDILYALRINFNITLIPHEKLRFLVVEGGLYYGSWISLTLFWLPQMGMPAIPTGYFTANLMMMVVSYSYQHFFLGLRIRPDNLRLMGKVLLLGIGGFLAAHTLQFLYLRLAVCGAIVIVMLAWLPTRDEYRDVLSLLKRKIPINHLGGGS